MASLFYKILEQKMGQTEAPSESRVEPQAQEFFISVQNITAPRAARVFQGSLYIEYQKDPRELERLRLEREKQVFCVFLGKLPSEKAKKAAENFYRYGVRRFLSGQLSDLKKDFRTLAKQVHPDVHSLATEEKRRYFHKEFQLLRESFDILSREMPIIK